MCLEEVCAGVQSRPPQEVLLQHVSYFELKALKTLQAFKELLPLPERI